MEKELTQLGLGIEESKIYLALLGIGQSTAGPIVKHTGLHRQRVYDNLAKLEQKKLVVLTKKSNRQHWIAVNPEELVNKAKSIHDSIQTLFPRLLRIQSKGAVQEQFKVYEGYTGIKLVHKENIKLQAKNSAVGVIGSSGWDWVDTMKKAKYFRPFERIRLEKNIKLQLIFFESERKKTAKLVEKYFSKGIDKKRYYRFLSDDHKSPVGIQVWDNNVTLIIYSEPIIIFQIYNPLVVKDFQKHFTSMWKIAKK